MQLIHDAVSSDLVAKCIGEIHARQNLDVWGFSKWKWGQSLTKGMRNYCLSTKPSPEVIDQIKVSLNQYFCSPITNVNYHVWLPGSGINWHDDGSNDAGGTLYLNTWIPELGGVFMWKDKDTDELKSISPVENMMIVNNNHERHAVSPILAGENAQVRMSVQIFCKNND